MIMRTNFLGAISLFVLVCLPGSAQAQGVGRVFRALFEGFETVGAASRLAKPALEAPSTYRLSKSISDYSSGRRAFDNVDTTRFARHALSSEGRPWAADRRLSLATAERLSLTDVKMISDELAPFIDETPG